MCKYIIYSGRCIDRTRDNYYFGEHPKSNWDCRIFAFIGPSTVLWANHLQLRGLFVSVFLLLPAPTSRLRLMFDHISLFGMSRVPHCRKDDSSRVRPAFFRPPLERSFGGNREEIAKLNTCMCLINKCHENTRNRSSTVATCATRETAHLAASPPTLRGSEAAHSNRSNRNENANYRSENENDTFAWTFIVCSRRNNSRKGNGVHEEGVQWAQNFEPSSTAKSADWKIQFDNLLDMVQFGLAQSQTRKNDNRVNRAASAYGCLVHALAASD